MPLTTTYDADKALIRLFGEGTVTMDERRRWVGEMLVDPRYRNDSEILVDVTGVTNAPAGGEFLQVGNLVKMLRSRFTGRIAIVNGRAGHLTISQLVAMSADLDGEFVRFFYTVAEAFIWLNR